MHAEICLVLERNDSSGFNPDAAREQLEAEGMPLSALISATLLKQCFSGQAHSLAMKNRLNDSFENDRAVSRCLRRPKPILERDSWQSCGRPFEVLFGMSIMSLLCLNAVLSQSF